jgi:dolichol-phosphate mannosyltransferase
MVKIIKNTYGYITANLINPRFLKFAIVGGSGVIVNMGLLFILSEFFHIHYIISSIIAIETSIILNFVLNDIWTWADRAKKTFIQRFIQYHIAVGVTAILVNWILLIFLTEIVGLYYLVSNLIGIGAGTLANYVINDLWTFNKKS